MTMWGVIIVCYLVEGSATLVSQIFLWKRKTKTKCHPVRCAWWWAIQLQNDLHVCIMLDILLDIRWRKNDQQHNFRSFSCFRFSNIYSHPKCGLLGFSQKKKKIQTDIQHQSCKTFWGKQFNQPPCTNKNCGTALRYRSKSNKDLCSKNWPSL